MAVSQNLAKPYIFFQPEFAEANWIWLESFLPLAKMAIAFRLLRVPADTDLTQIMCAEFLETTDKLNYAAS